MQTSKKKKKKVFTLCSLLVPPLVRFRASAHSSHLGIGLGLELGKCTGVCFNRTKQIGVKAPLRREVISKRLDENTDVVRGYHIDHTKTCF